MCLYFHAHSRKQFSFETYDIMMPKKKKKSQTFRRKLSCLDESWNHVGPRKSYNILPIKSSSSNKCAHTEQRKRKSSIWIQQHVSLSILDNGELNDSTFDPLLCEVHYYLFQIIVHFKSPTVKKHVKSLKEHWCLPQKLCETLLWKHFCWGRALVVSGRREWASVLPLFKFVYLKYISMETRPVPKLTLGLSLRGMKRKI